VTPSHPSVSPRDLRIVGAGALILLFALCTVTLTDTDLWGHTKFGLDMLQDHELPSDDPYSFTQDRPWINHEWASELKMGMAYALAGPTGLALLKGLLTFTALVLIWRGLRNIDPTARMIIFGIAAASTVPVSRTLRPQAWSLVLLVILCRILIEDRTRLRWVLPVLFAAWANVHGGWIVGFGILATWAVVDLSPWGRRDATYLPVAIVSLLATLVTPYGWQLWAFLLDTVRLGRDITEWRPLFRQPPPDWVPWLVAVATALWFLRRPHVFRLHVVAILTMLAFSSFRVMRIAPLFVACAAVLLSPWFRARWPSRSRESVGTSTGVPGAPPDQRLIAAGLCTAAVILAAFVASKSLTCVRTEGTWIPDAEAAAVLTNAPAGRLVTFFNWGEYALWHFGPRLRVSMDGRRETVYSESRLLEHDGIIRGTPLGFSTLANWNAEYVWLPADTGATRTWLLANGYRIDKETARSYVATRRDIPVLNDGGRRIQPGGGCFPD
jgi:hypothetical protein